MSDTKTHNPESRDFQVGEIVHIDTAIYVVLDALNGELGPVLVLENMGNGSVTPNYSSRVTKLPFHNTRLGRLITLSSTPTNTSLTVPDLFRNSTPPSSVREA